MPDDGVAKPPNTPDNPRVGARMKAAGAAAGIDFTGKTDRAPNSVRAHAVLDYALEQHGAGAQNALMEVCDERVRPRQSRIRSDTTIRNHAPPQPPPNSHRSIVIERGLI